MTADVALVIAQALIKYGPALAQELIKIFEKETITVEDWNVIFAISKKSYEDYVKPV